MVAEFKIDWHKAIEDAAIDYADEYCELQCDSENDHQRAHREALLMLRETIKAALSKAPAWHYKPTAPGDWVMRLPSGLEMQEQITQKEIDEDQHWPGRWYGPIPSEGDCPERIA